MVKCTVTCFSHMITYYSHTHMIIKCKTLCEMYASIPPPIRAPISALKPLFLPYHILHFFSLSHSHTLISVGLSHLLQIFWVRCELVREERCKQGELLHKDHCCFKKKKKTTIKRVAAICNEPPKDFTWHMKAVYMLGLMAVLCCTIRNGGFS